MRYFQLTTDVSAPPERVWEVMSDTDRWHEWTPSVKSVKRLHGKPFAVGNRVVIRQPGFPPAIWKITGIEPGRSFTWTSRGPGFLTIGRHSIEPTSAGSRVTLSLELQGLLGGVFGRLTRKVNERYIAMEAEGLRNRSENPAYIVS